MHVLANRMRDDVVLGSAGARLVRIEEAALNATAVREQQLYDGWLLRWAASPSKRARSVNVVAPPAGALDERLAFARQVYASRGMPLVFRLTEICPDPGLDDALAARGFAVYDETFVMSAPVREPVAGAPAAEALRFVENLPLPRFAAEVGVLRGKSAEHVAEHARRLQALAVKTLPLVAYRGDACVGTALAAFDGDLVGLFDVSTHPDFRRRGIATALMNRLMACAAEHGATQAYLQVESGNVAARSLYARLGFTDCYRYWYRSPAG